MVAAARLAREMQQRRREERRERQSDIGIAPKRRGNFGRPFGCRACYIQPVARRSSIQHIVAARRRHTGRRHHLIARSRETSECRKSFDIDRRADSIQITDGHSDDPMALQRPGWRIPVVSDRRAVHDRRKSNTPWGWC
jgi:hypothetical protein